MRKLLLLQLIVLGSLSMTQNTWSQTNLDQNLVLHYNFDKNGKNAAQDKYHLKIDDATEKRWYAWEAGKDDKPETALKFWGNSDGLNTGLDISPDKMPELTYTAWVYGRPLGYVFGTSLPYDADKKYTSRTLQVTKKNINAECNRWTSDHKPFFSNINSKGLEEDQWNFVAMTVKAQDSTMMLYANGEFYELKKDVKVFHSKKPNTLIIGFTKSNTMSPRLNGRIDEIRVYDKALSTEELTQLSGVTFKSAKERAERTSLINMILLWTLIVFLVLATLYMIYVLFTEKKYKAISDAEFNQFAIDAKSNPDFMATNQLAHKYVEDAFETWKVVGGTPGDEFRSPSTRKNFVDTYAALDKAKALKPTDKAVTNKMNELGEILNDLSKRRFYGNIALSIIALILPLVMLLIQWKMLDAGRIGGVVVLALPAIVYILANFAPTYVVANRSGRFSGLFGGIIAAIMGVGAATAAAQHYNQITWSDGSKTVESDLGSDTASLGIGLALIIAAILLSVVLVTIAATIAFFRNYVFYK
jgi:hypothetical protein